VTVVPRRIHYVDVFTTAVGRGNPVAVVLDSESLTTDDMQRFASWTNLSETTFVTPPTDPRADYAVRIFTPSEELPFAGHPTLGTCHAWLAVNPAHRSDAVVQQCGVGLVKIRRTSDGLAFAAPPLIRSGPVEESLLERVASTLGIGRDEIVDAQWADNGPGWVAIRLADADAVLALRPGHSDDDLFVGVVGAYPAGSAAAFEVRAFVWTDGFTAEDPVTGSVNASIAQWLMGTGIVAAPYVVSQGTVLGRTGRVHIDQDEDGTIWVGGGTVTGVVGELVG
jgi:PhzF family phenazine biosynthesis protein